MDVSGWLGADFDHFGLGMPVVGTAHSAVTAQPAFVASPAFQRGPGKGLDEGSCHTFLSLKLPHP